MRNLEPSTVSYDDRRWRPRSWRNHLPAAALAIIMVFAGARWLKASDGEPAVWSGAARLAVKTLDSEGTPLAGVTLSLCSFESGRVHARGREDRECQTEFSKKDGSAAFDEVPIGKYRLTGSLDGFAGTSVFPLYVGSSKDGPMAPDRVTVLLNPVCFHC